MIDIGEVFRDRFDRNVAETVEALALLVSVQSISATGDRFSFQHPVVDYEQFCVSVVANSEGLSWQLQLPGCLDQPPPCLDLGGNISVLKLLYQPEQVLGEPDAFFIPLPFVCEESDADFAVVNNMKGVDHIVKP